MARMQRTMQRQVQDSGEEAAYSVGPLRGCFRFLMFLKQGTMLFILSVEATSHFFLYHTACNVDTTSDRHFTLHQRPLFIGPFFLFGSFISTKNGLATRAFREVKAPPKNSNMKRATALPRSTVQTLRAPPA